MLHCGGCGIQLQHDDKNQLGYTPKSALTREGDVLCQRCFQMRHYNKNVAVSIDDGDFLKMISSIRDTDSLVVHLIDIFDVNGTLLSSLPRFVGENRVILVGNKLDLLPKSTNIRKLKHWLFRLAREAGIRVVDVYLISSKNGRNLDELAAQLEKEGHGKDIYVVGVTNVGKSTFINQFIKNSTGIKEMITTSYYPGTTLGFIDIPLDKHSSLIDTPGIINNHQMAHYVSDKDLRKITPHKEVKARTYQLNHQQTLFIGGLARFDFVKGDAQSFVCYFSNDIHIHRTKLENADQLYNRHLGDMLVPPDKETQATLPPLIKQSFKITEPYTDIVFPGLGWITIINGYVTIDIYSPKGISVSLRQSFVDM